MQSELFREYAEEYAEEREAIGKAIGEIEGKIKVAKNLIKIGLDDDKIQMVTGLATEQINELRKAE